MLRYESLSFSSVGCLVSVLDVMRSRFSVGYSARVKMQAFTFTCVAIYILCFYCYDAVLWCGVARPVPQGIEVGACLAVP